MMPVNSKTDIAAVVAWLLGGMWVGGLTLLYYFSMRCDPVQVIPLVTAHLP